MRLSFGYSVDVHLIDSFGYELNFFSIVMMCSGYLRTWTSVEEYIPSHPTLLILVS